MDNSRAQNAPNTSEPHVGWLDHWRLSTFSFGVVDKDQNKHDFSRVIGTGIFVATAPDKGYFVTAKHVFDDPSKNWHPKNVHLRFGWQERQSVYDYLGTTLALVDSTGKQLWLASDDGADIAALPVVMSELALTSDVQPHAIFLADIATKDALFEGASLVILGYPGIVGNEYLVRSIVRAGIVAWLSPDDPYGKPFLIDANIYPGNSGGPVIKIPTGITKEGGFSVGGKVSLLGIVSKAPGVDQDFTLIVPGSPQPLHLKQTIP